MSKKYTPSFLREQQCASSTVSATVTANRFNALSDDATAVKRLVNTSLPAKNAVPLVPGTLASLTATALTALNGDGATGLNGTTGAKSFASTFTDKQRQLENPNYKSTTKPIDIKSEDDFPSLGSAKSLSKSSSTGGFTTKVVDIKPVVPPQKQNFADLAKGWAKKTADEEEEELRKQQEEFEQRERELIMGTFVRHRRAKKLSEDDDDEEEDYNAVYDEPDSEYSSVPEGDEDDLGSYDDEETNSQERELNSGLGNERRHHDDLY